jgi:hypothetical protein
MARNVRLVRTVLRVVENLTSDPLEPVIDGPLTGELRQQPRLQNQGSRVAELTVTRAGPRTAGDAPRTGSGG